MVLFVPLCMYTNELKVRNLSTSCGGGGGGWGGEGVTTGNMKHIDFVSWCLEPSQPLGITSESMQQERIT